MHHARVLALLAVCSLAASAACTKAAPAPAQPISSTADADADADASEPAGSDPVAPAALPDVSGTLHELQNGDLACYVILTDASGAEVDYPGGFDLCGQEQEALIGKPVTLHFERTDMPDCDSAEPCERTTMVDLVVSITAN